LKQAKGEHKMWSTILDKKKHQAYKINSLTLLAGFSLIGALIVPGLLLFLAIGIPDIIVVLAVAYVMALPTFLLSSVFYNLIPKSNFFKHDLQLEDRPHNKGHTNNVLLILSVATAQVLVMAFYSFGVPTLYLVAGLFLLTVIEGAFSYHQQRGVQQLSSRPTPSLRQHPVPTYQPYQGPSAHIAVMPEHKSASTLPTQTTALVQVAPKQSVAETGFPPAENPAYTESVAQRALASRP
jgi:hypothetical protein